MELTPVTAPTAEPLSLAEVKAHLRVDTTADDALIQGLIVTARAYLDGWSGTLGRALMTQTWDMQLAFFTRLIKIPLPPLASVVTVKYWNDADTSVLTTVADTVYRVEATAGFIELIDDQSWPSDIESRVFPIVIQFVAGYGAFNDVPEAIRHAMLLMIGHWYENREEVTVASMQELPLGAATLLAPYEVARL